MIRPPIEETLIMVNKLENVINGFSTIISAKDARIKELEDALRLIAAPKRPDGTYNRCREACEELAHQALGEKEGG